MLILFELFLGILPLDPAFSSITFKACTACLYTHLTVNRHMETSSTLLWNHRDTLKTVICPSILQALFLLLCDFHMNLKIQNS